ncbi:mycothiol synthase [Brevibacterium daeguense]|uniref:Mycothiol acetyltransferase n=1 Tax=Brevibacterium daeguense TaxID=909936 RepID=A0ABP8EGR2_9MICO|nr:mycothiol synthase [Brevibacterium daeguense]
MTRTEIRPVDSAPEDVSGLLSAATAADGLPPISDGLLDAAAAAAPDTRMWEVRENAGELLGFGISAQQGERGAAEAVLAPEARGRGLGGRLIEQMHAALLASGRPSWFWSHGDHPAAAHLADRLGYARERELLQLHTDPLTRLSLPATEAPAGTAIRPFRPGDEDGWLRVNNAAFDWHPEQGGQTRADIDAIVSAPGFSPEDVIIAERDGQVVGFHQLKLHRDHPSGTVTGEVYVIGVDPQAHARGLGRALTLAGMHRLRDLGAGAIELYVESDNVPARRLYESLGFTHTIVHVSYAPPQRTQES